MLKPKPVVPFDSTTDRGVLSICTHTKFFVRGKKDQKRDGAAEPDSSRKDGPIKGNRCRAVSLSQHDRYGDCADQHRKWAGSHYYSIPLFFRSVTINFFFFSYVKNSYRGGHNSQVGCDVITSLKLRGILESTGPISARRWLPLQPRPFGDKKNIFLVKEEKKPHPSATIP